MKETGTFLPGAALAIAVAIPIAAISAVVLSDEGDDRVPCDGCGELYAPDDLALGPFDSRWCSRCDASAAPAFDCVQEDDGEP